VNYRPLYVNERHTGYLYYLFATFTGYILKNSLRMRVFFTKVACLLLTIFFATASRAQQNFFTDIAESAANKAGQKRVIVPEKYRTLQLDTAAMLPFLRSLPSEQNITDRNTTPILLFPMPDGSVAKFHVWESSIMEPGLAAAFPHLKTFTGQGIDDRTATIKMDWTEFGFHAMVLSPVTGDIFIDPYAQAALTNYISYYKQDFKKKEIYTEWPIEKNVSKNLSVSNPNEPLAGVCTGGQLRTYRLAIACTGEYAVAATGLPSPTKAQVLSKVVTTVTRVDGVYEKELAIRLVLVANDTAVLFTNASTDPFTANNDGPALLNQSQTQITNRIGSANFDIGHTFSTGAGGVAVQGVCATNEKAMGVTGSNIPTGDPYDIDYVAHEMGHQFGAQHTFNSQLMFCSGNGVSSSNSEPGSGSTVMAYAGICSATDNLQPHSNDYFNAISHDEISDYSNLSTGSTCPVTTITGNSAPIVNAGSDYIIPRSTYFMLTGSATDINGDALTYCWEQVDVGGPFGVWNAPSGNAPLFRSFSPVVSPVRYFPKLLTQIRGTDSIGEILPSYARTMKFRLTSRDNRAGGGGVCYDENLITVASSGPFTVINPNSSGITWYVNDFQTVLWSPNGTTTAPVSCANVSIQLSTDGGYTFPITLLASTPNDGSAEIQVSNNITATARIRVMAVGNIFYDISNNNFSIQNSPTSTFSFNNPELVGVCAADSGTATLKSGSLNNLTTPIVLSASLNPVGTTVVFGVTSLAPGNSTTVSLRNTSSLAPGTYTVRVTGIAGAVTKTKDIQFLVGGGGAAPAVLTSPVNDAIGQSDFPLFNWAQVSGAFSYTLEISTTNDFAVIVQTIPNISSLPYTLVTPLLENTVYYWRVKTTNACGTGNPSSVPNRFKTWLNTCKTARDVPKSISPSGAPTVTSTITVPAAAGVTITDLNVTGLNVSHSYVGDLTFTLRGPNNVSVIMANRVCDGGYQNFNLSFDGQATTTYANLPCPPDNGSIVQSQNSLTVFNGISSAGTWTLTVKDNADGDGGSLNSWGLNINGTTTTGCTITSTPLAITYTFTGNGNWSDAANWSSNTIPPNPLPPNGSIVINHTAGGSCTLNLAVAQVISAGATLTVMTGKNLIVPGTLTIQ
jgi:subtilisin-like proprotein convertase family protein